MQISGTSLLIAAQQQPPQAATRGAQPASFAATLPEANEAKDTAFSPLSFKAAEHPQKPPQPAESQPVTAEQKPAQSLGSTLDIRV